MPDGKYSISLHKILKMNAAIDLATRKGIEGVPEITDLTKLFLYVNSHDINARYLNFLKALTNLSDDIISGWLSINARTFRNYRKAGASLKHNTKEHVVALIALYKHGIDVFEGQDNFDRWLTTPNYTLDMKSPTDFLDTISGIKFIDDRLTAIEHGDNV